MNFNFFYAVCWAFCLVLFFNLSNLPLESVKTCQDISINFFVCGYFCNLQKASFFRIFSVLFLYILLILGVPELLRMLSVEIRPQWIADMLGNWLICGYICNLQKASFFRTLSALLMVTLTVLAVPSLVSMSSMYIGHIGPKCSAAMLLAAAFFVYCEKSKNNYAVRILFCVASVIAAIMLMRI